MMLIGKMKMKEVSEEELGNGNFPRLIFVSFSAHSSRGFLSLY
jgi:hypothetical protein